MVGAYRGIEAANDTATLGDLPDVDPQLICCPEVDYANNGRPNMPVKSCALRHKDPQHKTCHGASLSKNPDGTHTVINCKGKTPGKTHRRRATYFQQEHVARNGLLARLRAQQRHAGICIAYLEGAPIDNLAEAYSHRKDYITSILRKHNCLQAPETKTANQETTP